MSVVYLNGALLPTEEASIPVTDRGFRLGDGLFETIALYHGTIYQWEHHVTRLQRGCTTLNIPCPDTHHLATTLQELAQQNHHTEQALARITLTRGSGSRGYLPRPTSDPTLLIETMPRPPAPKKESKLWVASWCKPSPKALPTDCKTLQGLNSILARTEADARGYLDGLLLTEQGQVCECASGNIFWLRQGTLYTPSPNTGCLPGTTRNRVLELAAPHIPIKEGAYTLEALTQAEACFVTSTYWQVLPIIAIDSQKGTLWAPQEPATHPLTHLIQQALLEDIARVCGT